MKRLLQASRLALLLLCVAFSAAEARADVKIKTRQTSNGQASEGATYIKGKRQRTESPGGQMIVIQECDLRRDIQIMPQAKAYVVRSYEDASAATATPASSARVTNTTTTKGGLVTSTVTMKDTGERKQMFGYTARHIITTIVTVSSPDSCSPMDSKMEMDGWYIDAAFALDCDAARGSSYYRPQTAGGCQDKYQTKQIGTAKKGFAVWEKMTMFGTDGSVSFSTVNEVVELSQATLDASLFEVPAGYREVKDFSEAYATSASADDDGSSNSATGANSSNAANVKGVADATGAKKAGVIRLGLVSVTTGSVAEHINASELAAAVGNTLAARLNRSNVEVVRIEATMPFGIDAEAKRKECDFLIYANVSHKKGGGGGFGGMLGKVSSAVAKTGSGVYAGGDEQGGAGAGATSASVSASVKSKDELTLDLKMQSPTGASPDTERQFKAKARSAGEDIISSVVEQAAQVVLGAAATK
jgi:hypothetical protein